MKVILSIALFFVLGLSSRSAEAHAFGEPTACESKELVGVWRVNDIDKNSVEPGRQVALARTGDTFNFGGHTFSVFTVVGMGFRRHLETKGFGFCRVNNKGVQEYVVVSFFSNDYGLHIAFMTPHTGEIEYDDIACQGVKNPSNCEEYFEKLQTRLLAIVTVQLLQVSLDLTDVQNRNQLLSNALELLKPMDLGNGHSHGGSGSD